MREVVGDAFGQDEFTGNLTFPKTVEGVERIGIVGF